MLTTTVDTRTIPGALRSARWKEATERFLVPLQIAASAAPVTGRITGTRRDDLSLCHLLASAHSGVRTADLAAGAGSENVKIAIATHGVVTVSQHGRVAHLKPGQWAVYDTSSEYEVGGAAAFGLFIALVPHTVFGAGRTAVAAAAAMPFDPAPATRELLTAAQTRGSLRAPVDAIGGFVHHAADRFRARGLDDEAVFTQAADIIRGRIDDPDLSPAYLAAVIGVSRRRLYTVFGQRVGPIAEHIRAERMNLARSLLTDDVARSVGDIALACGFADQAHFSRVFRAAFGRSPLQERKASAGAFAAADTRVA